MASTWTLKHKIWDGATINMEGVYANQNLQIQLNVSTYTYVSFIAQVWNLLVCVNM